MPEGMGYGKKYKLYGAMKSDAKYADMNMDSGNYGKPIGDKGVKNPKGNSRTMCAADRYKSNSSHSSHGRSGY